VRSTPEAILVHHNGHTQVLDCIGIRFCVPGQERTNERAESVVELATGFGGNRIKDKGRFPRARDTGYDGNLALWNAQRDIL